MKFLADESVDDPVVFLLRANKYDIEYIKELCPGANDEVVLKLGLDSNSILITMDKDFGELVYRRKQQHTGVVLLRLEGHTPIQRANIVLSVFEKHSYELVNAFTVIQPNFSRIRPM